MLSLYLNFPSPLNFVALNFKQIMLFFVVAVFVVVVVVVVVVAAAAGSGGCVKVRFLEPQQ